VAGAAPICVLESVELHAKANASEVAQKEPVRDIEAIRIGDRVRADSPLATTPGEIPHDTHGRVTRVWSDGDLGIHFDGFGVLLVKQHELCKLSTIGKATLGIGTSVKIVGDSPFTGKCGTIVQSDDSIYEVELDSGAQMWFNQMLVEEAIKMGDRVRATSHLTSAPKEVPSGTDGTVIRAWRDGDLGIHFVGIGVLLVEHREVCKLCMISEAIVEASANDHHVVKQTGLACTQLEQHAQTIEEGSLPQEEVAQPIVHQDSPQVGSTKVVHELDSRTHKCEDSPQQETNTISASSSQSNLNPRSTTKRAAKTKAKAKAKAKANNFPSYTGYFSHPQVLGGKKMDITLQMSAEAKGDWTVGKKTIQITASFDGDKVTFDDGMTQFVGERDSKGNLKGEVLQEGVAGGGFALKQRKEKP
jgi:hypothetical protein